MNATPLASFRALPSPAQAAFLMFMLVASPVTQGVAATSEPRCAGDARERAAKLLALHAETSNGAIAREVRALPSIRNPADTKQRFSVLGVDGYVYKATYRMRFIYAPISDTCVLMGQEILEFARP